MQTNDNFSLSTLLQVKLQSLTNTAVIYVMNSDKSTTRYILGLRLFLWRLNKQISSGSIIVWPPLVLRLIQTNQSDTPV